MNKFWEGFKKQADRRAELAGLAAAPPGVGLATGPLAAAALAPEGQKLKAMGGVGAGGLAELPVAAAGGALGGLVGDKRARRRGKPVTRARGRGALIGSLAAGIPAGFIGGRKGYQVATKKE